MDYRDFEDGAATNASVAWWRATEDKAKADALTRAATHIAENQRYRSEANLRHARLYGNFDLVGFGPRQYGLLQSGPGNCISLNAVAACIDTLANKVGKSKPRPTYLTKGGDWGLQRKAARLDKFTIGLFDETRQHETGVEVLRDSLKFGTGLEHVFVDDFSERICSERVLPDELLVDDADGVHGTPRQLLRQKPVPREVLLDLYGTNVEARAIIRGAKRIDDESGLAHTSLGDMVLVVEGWHLRSGPDAKNGKHLLAIEGLKLWEEEWTKSYFPFAAMRYVKRDCGFWGQGIAERLTGIQLEINRIIQDVREILRMYKPKMVVFEDSGIPRNHIRGGAKAIPDVLLCKGGPQMAPVLLSASGAVPTEYLMQLDRLWNRAFEHEGVSQLDAMAKKPAGLNSGVAIRDYNEIGTERHVLVGQQYEQLHVDVGRIEVDFARDLAAGRGVKHEQRKGYVVNVALRKALHPVDWSDIQLEEEQYRMQSFPVSSLPTTPAARRQEVDEWVQRGWIQPEEAPRLMNMPDLDEASSLLNASLDDIDAAIDDILDGAEAEAPDELFENIELRISRGMSAYLRAKRQGAPLGVLYELRNFVTMAIDVRARQAKRERAAAAAQPPAPPAAMGLPAPAPGLPGPAPAGPPLPPGGVPPVLQ